MGNWTIKRKTQRITSTKGSDGDDGYEEGIPAARGAESVARIQPAAPQLAMRFPEASPRSGPFSGEVGTS
jgi:hypothetical protein